MSGLCIVRMHAVNTNTHKKTRPRLANLWSGSSSWLAASPVMALEMINVMLVRPAPLVLGLVGLATVFPVVRAEHLFSLCSNGLAHPGFCPCHVLYLVMYSFHFLLSMKRYIRPKLCVCEEKTEQSDPQSLQQ